VPTDVSYTMTLQNADGSWNTQFSFDEQGMTGLYLTYWLLFTFVAAVHLYSVWILWKSNSYALTVKLLSVVYGLFYFSLFFVMIHYLIYKDNGVGSSFCLGLGSFLDMSCQIFLVALLVLIAKGWNITRVEITNKLYVIIGLASIVLAYLILFIWNEVGFDPASSVYLYDTAPGIILVIFRSLVMLWFIYELYLTFKEETNDQKRNFYVYFGLGFSLWFVILPFVVVVASILDAWIRFKVVQGMYVTANCVALGGLMWLLWPSRSGEVFQLSKPDQLFGSESSPQRPTSYDTL